MQFYRYTDYTSSTTSSKSFCRMLYTQGLPSKDSGSQVFIGRSQMILLSSVENHSTPLVTPPLQQLAAAVNNSQAEVKTTSAK